MSEINLNKFSGYAERYISVFVFEDEFVQAKDGEIEDTK